MTWSRKNLETRRLFNNSFPARQFVLHLFAVFRLVYVKKKKKKDPKMPLYQAWDVKRETRKAVAAGNFEEFATVGELFCCLISEIQSHVYNECLQKGYDNNGSRSCHTRYPYSSTVLPEYLCR